MRQALTMLDVEDDRLLASRVYSSYASLCHEFDGHLPHHEALERAVAYADDVASEELATALSTMALWHMRFESYAASLAYADRALAVCAEVDLPVLAAQTLLQRAFVCFALGRVTESWAIFDEAAASARRGGAVADAMEMEFFQTDMLIFQLDPERGLSEATALRARAQSAGLPDLAGWVGVLLAEGLMLQGRLGETDLLLAALVEEGVPEESKDWRNAMIRLRLLQGSAAAALPLVRRAIELWRAAVVPPDWFNTLLHVEVLTANGMIDESVTALELDAPIHDSEGAFTLAGLACAGYVVLTAAKSAGRPVDEPLLARSDDFLDRGQALMTEEGARTWEGSYFPLAVALRADLLGEPSAEAWRAAYDACSRIGPGHALRSGLGLAAALLTAGERDEARVLLPGLFSRARGMGAKGFEAEAARLARRHRITLPGDDGPTRLDVLTAREREVLDVLVTGATNRVIAERLFISEKTVSVHVTNLLAKLGLLQPWRGGRAGPGSRARGLRPPQAPSEVTRAP